MEKTGITKKILFFSTVFLFVFISSFFLSVSRNIYAAENADADEIRNLSDYERASLYMKMISDIPKEKLTDLSYIDRHYSLTENEQKEITEFTKSLVSDLKEDEEKALKVHDWITENIYYDYDGLYSNKRNMQPYVAFETRKAVCGGYTSLYMTMLRAIGIPCIDANGIANGDNHAWNVVIIEDIPFVVDCTWDTYNKYIDGQFIKGEVSHKYYNCELEGFLTSHKWEQNQIYDMKIGDFLYGYFEGFLGGKDQLNISEYIGNEEEVTFPNQAYGYKLYGVQLANPYDGEIHLNVKKIKKVTFSEGFEYLRQGIFPDYCTSLTDVILPSSVKSFDFYDFVAYNNGNYRNVKLEFCGTTPPDFTNSSSVKSKNIIIVPKGCAELYKNALNAAGETECIVYEKGEEIKINEFTHENGNLQYYDSTGIKIVNKLITVNGYTYYFDNNGNACSGLITIQKNKYYFDTKSHQMVKNKIVTIKNKKYFFDKKGILLVNKSVTIDKVTYKANKDGILTKIKEIK